MAQLDGTLDVQRFIDERRFSPYQWMILILCFLIVAADGFDTASIGFVAPALVQEWHPTKAALWPVMSAALFGLAIGALFAGPLADRIGRKRVLIGSVLSFGMFSVLCSFSSSLSMLAVMRLLTGIGLGAAMPNATTLMSEYSPARMRALIVNTMFCGFTVGASAGGLVAAIIIPHFGWRSVFVVGGILPLALSVVLIVLPESIRFMVLRGWHVEKISAVLRRMAPEVSLHNLRFVLPEDSDSQKRSGLAVVLSGRFRAGTVLLWITYFAGLLVYYLLTSWLPTLIRDTGFTIREASIVTALFPLGGRYWRHWCRLADGSVRAAQGHCRYLCADRILRVAGRAAIGEHHVARCADVRGRCLHERRAVLAAGTCRGVLSDQRACDRRCLDAGRRPLWRDSRGVDGRLPSSSRRGVQHHLRTARGAVADRGGCADDQARRLAKRSGGNERAASIDDVLTGSWVAKRRRWKQRRRFCVGLLSLIGDVRLIRASRNSAIRIKEVLMPHRDERLHDA